MFFVFVWLSFLNIFFNLLFFFSISCCYPHLCHCKGLFYNIYTKIHSYSYTDAKPFVNDSNEGHAGRPRLIMQYARGRVLSLPWLIWLSHPRLLPAETTGWELCELDIMQHSIVCWEQVTPLSKLIWHSQVKQVRSFKTFLVLFFFCGSLSVCLLEGSGVEQPVLVTLS